MKTEVAWWLEAGERAAFHCQQAAEKLLKGLIMHRGALWQRTRLGA
jgi:HEPN domain-containing protein